MPEDITLWSMPAVSALSMRPPVAHTDTPFSYLHLSTMCQPLPRECTAGETPVCTFRGRSISETGRRQSGNQRRRPGRAALLPVSADLPLRKRVSLPSQRAFERAPGQPGMAGQAQGGPAHRVLLILLLAFRGERLG